MRQGTEDNPVYLWAIARLHRAQRGRRSLLCLVRVHVPSGGGNPGATKMTQPVAFADMLTQAADSRRSCDTLFRCSHTRRFGGAARSVAARPVVWAVQAFPEELGLPYTPNLKP